MKYGVILFEAARPFGWSSGTSKPEQGNTATRMAGRVTDSAGPATRAAKESRKSREFVFQTRDDELRVLKTSKACYLEENAETH
jgi:hypothetical protein